MKIEDTYEDNIYFVSNKGLLLPLNSKQVYKSKKTNHDNI